MSINNLNNELNNKNELYDKDMIQLKNIIHNKDLEITKLEDNMKDTYEKLNNLNNTFNINELELNNIKNE
jgi:hypothetical protein